LSGRCALLKNCRRPANAVLNFGKRERSIEGLLRQLLTRSSDGWKFRLTTAYSIIWWLAIRDDE
jgi:hypothetical protein